LRSALRFELEPTSDIKNVYMFATAAIFIILIACINFMNLSTAKSMLRIKEIGIRKTVGSTRKQLIRQFLSESIFTSLLALGLGLILVFLLLPGFNNLIGREMDLQGVNLPIAILGLLAFAILVGILAGVYPAFYLSSFRPVNVFKGAVAGGKFSSVFRNGLVAFQFIISISLIISTLTVYRQLDFVQNTDLGFNKNQVLVIKNLQPDPKKSETFRQGLIQHVNVISASCAGNLPGKGFGSNWLNTEDGDTLLLGMFFCDFSYQETLHLQMTDGRFFSPEFATDSTGLVLNEHAVRAYNLEDPVGKRVNFYYGRSIELRIIGIVKDFYIQSLHQPIRPLGIVYGINKDWGINYIAARINTTDVKNTIQFVEKTWKSVYPDLPFEYSFLDEEYSSLYANELRTGRTAVVFCVLAIFICCLGLLGLASFVAERRYKEIGIRKVLGASIPGVFMIVCKDLAKWALLANIIAWPVAYYIMDKWLQNFAYGIQLEWWTFILAGTLALGIAVLTVSYQSVRVARANPVDALRYE